MVLPVTRSNFWLSCEITAIEKSSRGESAERVCCYKGSVSWVLRLPGRPVVQFIVSNTHRELPCLKRLPFVPAAKLSGALVETILVGAAPQRLMIGMRHNHCKQVVDLVETLLKFFFGAFRH